MIEEIQDERRQFRRMVINSPVEVIGSGQHETGICRDLSAQGMGIELPEPMFASGDMVMVSLATASNKLPPFQAQARVIRALTGDGAYHLAVEFVDVVKT